MFGPNALGCNIVIFVSASILLTITNGAFANDLLSVYSQAESNNPQLISSSLDYRILQERRNEIASGYDPSLSLNVRPSYDFRAKGDGNRTSIDYSLSLSKPIYQKRLNSRLSQADSVVRREQVNLEFQKQQLIARVATAYINVVSAQNKLNVSQAEQDVLRQNLEQTNTLFGSQLVTVTDVSETQLLLEQSNYTSSLASLELENARRDLQIETGRTYSSLAELDEYSELPLVQPNQLGEWIALANNFSHELQLARYDLQIQKKDVRIQRDSETTSIDLFASYDGETGEGRAPPDNRGGKVGLEFNIPLYSGDRNASKVRSSKLEYQKTQYALDIKMRELSQNIQLGFLTAMSGLENVHVLRNTVSTSQRKLSSIQQGKAAGTRTLSDVLTAMRDFYSVKRRYTEAKYKFLIDLVNLRLAAGVLTVDDLGAMNLLFSAGQNQAQRFNTQASSIDDSFIEAENEMMSLEDAWGIN